MGWVIFVSVLAFIGLAIHGAFSAQAKKDELIDKCVTRVRNLALAHADVLRRKKTQLVYNDEYGRTVTDRWHQEAMYFVDNVIRADAEYSRVDLELLRHTESLKQVRDVGAYNAALIGVIDHVVDQLPETKILESNINSGTDFEIFCQQTLSDHGWSVIRNGGTGDQGIDLIASKNGARVGVQCKFYRSPVGNAAVQEVIAGSKFHETTHAIVVTNSTYTTAAKQLASSAMVALLHYEELENLDEYLLNGKVPRHS